MLQRKDKRIAGAKNFGAGSRIRLVWYAGLMAVLPDNVNQRHDGALEPAARLGRQRH
jgi:hypothetical protein